MSKRTKVIYDIRVAEGDEGRRLASIQAKAIVDILTWTAAQRRRAADQEIVTETPRHSPAPDADTLQVRTS